MTNNSVKLWIPNGRMTAVSSALPKGALTNTISVLDGRLKTAELKDGGYLNSLKSDNVLVKVGYVHGDRDDRSVITGISGVIKHSEGDKHVKHVNHSMYTEGLRFTTYSEIDVHYHLGTHTTAETLGNARIEVRTPDEWNNLDDFVEAALDAYDFQGLKNTEREKHLLFYAAPKMLRRVAEYATHLA